MPITAVVVAVDIEATIVTEAVIVIDIAVAVGAIAAEADLATIISGVALPVIADWCRKYYSTIPIVVVAVVVKHTEQY